MFSTRTFGIREWIRESYRESVSGFEQLFCRAGGTSTGTWGVVEGGWGVPFLIPSWGVVVCTDAFQLRSKMWKSILGDRSIYHLISEMGKSLFWDCLTYQFFFQNLVLHGSNYSGKGSPRNRSETFILFVASELCRPPISFQQDPDLWVRRGIVFLKSSNRPLGGFDKVRFLQNCSFCHSSDRCKFQYLYKFALWRFGQIEYLGV